MRMRIYKIKRIKCCKLHLAQSLQSLYVRESGFRKPRNFCFWNPESGKLFARGMWNPELWTPEYSSGMWNPSSTDKHWNCGIQNPSRLSWIPLQGATLGTNGRCVVVQQLSLRPISLRTKCFFLLETEKSPTL